MSLAERRDVRRRTTSTIDRRQQQEEDITGDLTRRRDEARRRGDELYGDIRGGQRDVMEGGGYEPGARESVRRRADDIYGTGGYDDPSGLRSRVRERTDRGGTSGYDPNEVGYARTQGRGQVETAGYDPGQLSAVRSGYGDMIRTGGFGGNEEDLYRRNANAGVAGTFQNLRGEMERRAVRSGGQGFGGGELAQLARLGSQEAARTHTATEADLASQKRAGRLAGLGGLSDLESTFASGRRGALEGYRGFEGDVAAGTREGEQLGQRGLETEVGLERDIAAGRRTGADMGAELERDVAAGRRAGVESGTRLLGTTPAEEAEITQRMQDVFGIGGQQAIALLNNLRQNQGPGVFDNIMRALQVGSGAVAGIAGAGVF